VGRMQSFSLLKYVEHLVTAGLERINNSNGKVLSSHVSATVGQQQKA
jgi:hypothetical protein